jgi:hypothetical protein
MRVFWSVNGLVDDLIRWSHIDDEKKASTRPSALRYFNIDPWSAADLLSATMPLAETTMTRAYAGN